LDFGVEIAEHDFATLACKVQRLKQIALGMLPQAQTMLRRWNKRLPLMWALYVFHMMNMLLHLQRSRGDQSMRVRMRMMKGTREKLTWSHPKSLLNTWPSRPSHPNPWIRNPQL